MRHVSNNMLAPQGLITGAIEFGDDGHISQLTGGPISENEAREDALPLVIPDFVDSTAAFGMPDGGYAIDDLGPSRHGCFVRCGLARPRPGSH
jgi:hypothetical protein